MNLGYFVWLPCSDCVSSAVSRLVGTRFSDAPCSCVELGERSVCSCLKPVLPVEFPEEGAEHRTSCLFSESSVSFS